MIIDPNTGKPKIQKSDVRAALKAELFAGMIGQTLGKDLDVYARLAALANAGMAAKLEKERTKNSKAPHAFNEESWRNRMVGLFQEIVLGDDEYVETRADARVIDPDAAIRSAD